MKPRSAALNLTLALGILLAPLAADAQQSVKVYRIGYLGGGSPSTGGHLAEAFLQGLRELGYEEGKNIVIEYRWAEGRIERLPDLAAELVRLRVDVLFAPAHTMAVAAHGATKTTPIVSALLTEPVQTGLVRSLARPAGNLTGLAILIDDVSAKQLELLKEAVPKAIRVGVLRNPASPSSPLQLVKTQKAARAMGVELQIVDAGGPDELEGVFATLTAKRASALVVLADIMFFQYRKRIAELAEKHRLPGMYGIREHVEAGGLMSYGADFRDSFRRAATYVDKILKGGSPGDLPVEQPTKFELVINLKTAKALGLKIPQSILIRADQVIQ